MKKDYLKPEMDAIIELMGKELLMDVSPIKEDDGTEPDMAPRWKKNAW